MIKYKFHSASRVLGLAALAFASGAWSVSAMAAPKIPTATELYDWAEAAMPLLFPGHLPTVTGAGFTYRGPYSTGAYMGVEGSTVYALGPPTGNQLLAMGTLSDFACGVHPTSCTSSDALAKAIAFLASQDAIFASGLPANGEQAYAKLDTCYLHNGVTRAREVARFDADAEVRANLSRRVGARRTDIEVLAERNTTNTDGSARREIDVRYNLSFADGMVQRSLTETLVQGSSAGTSTVAGACGTPQNSQDLRALGNQRIVGFSLASVSSVFDRFKLADGTPNSPARRFRNEVRFLVTDPSATATYATVSGPGLSGGYKLISPQVLATAPEFAGKPGNTQDPLAEDTFRICWTAGSASLADATVADCTRNGAELNALRVQNADPAALDQAFVALGFTVGSIYTVNVFADDGWKTVNGQSGKTPIATYQSRLAALPESAATLAAGTSANFVDATFSLTPVDIAAAVRNKTTASLQVTIVKPAKASTPLRLENVYLFEQGRVNASAAYPTVRIERTTYPPSSATSLSSDIVGTPPQKMAVPTTAEMGINYNDLNGRAVRRVTTFD